MSCVPTLSLSTNLIQGNFSHDTGTPSSVPFPSWGSERNQRKKKGPRAVTVAVAVVVVAVAQRWLRVRGRWRCG